MKIVLIAKRGYADTGMGRYANELTQSLQALGHEVHTVYPSVSLPSWFVRAIRRWLGWDLAEFLNHYPIWAYYPPADVYHLTSQNLATLMFFRRPPGPTIITVHDIIPWLVRDDPDLNIYDHRTAEWFDRLALAGLRRADGLIADSEFTRQSLRRPDVGVGDSAVVALGVD
jgi:glycosyltransferase involved in cell wall biosynthesis